jgi:hypothetical protein
MEYRPKGICARLRPPMPALGRKQTFDQAAGNQGFSVCYWPLAACRFGDFPMF